MNEWAFEMYDWNEDGLLEMLDLSYFKKEVPEHSLLYKEINRLIDEYIEAKIFKREAKGINATSFSVVLGSNSVLSLVLFFIKV